jgi:hypothetical protein
MDLGRAESIDTRMRRREAVEQRLSSSRHQAKLVDTALASLDRQLADRGDVACADCSLRASARALRTVALGDADYGATLTPAHVPVAVRIHNTLFGLQIAIRPSGIGPPTGCCGVVGSCCRSEVGGDDAMEVLVLLRPGDPRGGSIRPLVPSVWGDQTSAQRWLV